MSSLLLAMPGSGKTTAMKNGLIQDVDYGYFRRSFGGLTDTGLIPELSSSYLKMLYLCSRKGIVAANCPELVSDYVLMGYNITVVVPEDPERRYVELFKREEGVPCDLEKYMQWYEEWTSMASERGLRLHRGNVMDVIPVVEVDRKELYPLTKFVDADLLRFDKLWSIEVWYRCESHSPGVEHYVALLGDGVVEVEVHKEGWSYSVWRSIDLTGLVNHRKTRLVGSAKKLPFLQ